MNFETKPFPLKVLRLGIFRRLFLVQSLQESGFWSRDEALRRTKDMLKPQNSSVAMVSSRVGSKAIIRIHQKLYSLIASLKNFPQNLHHSHTSILPFFTRTRKPYGNATLQNCVFSKIAFRNFHYSLQLIFCTVLFAKTSSSRRLT